MKNKCLMCDGKGWIWGNDKHGNWSKVRRVIKLTCPKCATPKYVPDGKQWEDFYECSACHWKPHGECAKYPDECNSEMHWSMCTKCGGKGIIDSKICKVCEGMTEIHIV